jgi:hypothetical protein
MVMHAALYTDYLLVMHLRLQYRYQNRKQTLLLNQLPVIKYGEHVIRWTINHEISTLSIHIPTTLFRNKVKLEKLNYYAVLYCLEGIISNEETDEIVISKIIRNNSVKEQAGIFFVFCVCMLV